jgi:uncharacterized protein YdcH (DUF465 family)
MSFLNHDLAHEFPEHLEKMHILKSTDIFFAKVYDTYGENNQAIKKFEMGGAVNSAEALELLQKQRLKTKHDIYQYLLKLDDQRRSAAPIFIKLPYGTRTLRVISFADGRVLCRR